MSAPIDDAVQWEEGMLLQPHHFQQESLRQSTVLAYHVAMATPYLWGVSLFEHDADTLSDGTFRVTQLEGRMPDGQEILYTAPNDEISDALQILLTGDRSELDSEAQSALDAGDPIWVYLVITELSEGSTYTGGQLPRYTVTSDEVTDLNVEDARSATIHRLAPAFRLYGSVGEPSGGVWFPLAQVQLANGAVGSTGYAPPCLQLGHSPDLWALCQDLDRELRDYVGILSDRLRSQAESPEPDQASQTRLLLQALLSALLPFEATYLSGAQHPWRVYRSLCGLLGALAYLDPDPIPDVPDYTHDALVSLFGGLSDRILTLLREGVQLGWETIEFSYADRRFAIEAQPDWAGSALILGVLPEQGMSEETAISWVERSLICSERLFESARRRRVLGVDRTAIDSYEDLSPPPGVRLFQLDEGSSWLDPEGALYAFNQDDEDDDDDELVGGKPTTSPAALYLFVERPAGS